MKTPEIPESKIIQELEEEQIREILRKHFIGSLAFISHSQPYVLPVSFFYDEQANCLISYSTEGHKIEAMRDNPAVALGVYEINSPVRWRSVLVHGRFEELRQIDAKANLHRFTEGIRKQVSPKNKGAQAFIEDFSSKTRTLGIPLVYRIRIDEWSGKYREG